MHKIKNITVIGEGKMGTSLFFYLHEFNYHLTWLCSSDFAKEKTDKLLRRKLKHLFLNGIYSEADQSAILECRKVTASIEDLGNCDLIIEAISENTEAKRKLFQSLHKIAKPECLFATNSSSVIPSQLMVPESRKDKTAGMHFFFPVTLKNSVELITSSSTSRDTRETLLQFLVDINKKPFLQNESDAFILNRIFLDFQSCAFRLLSDTILSCAEIDALVKQHMFPLGVFEFFDHVGIDIMLSSVATYTQNSDNLEFYSPMIKKLEEMVQRNFLGVKTGKGFYEYPNKAVLKQVVGNGLSAVKQRTVKDQLWLHYISSVSRVIEGDICSRDDLAGHVRDYLGIDRDPFIMI